MLHFLWVNTRMNKILIAFLISLISISKVVACSCDDSTLLEQLENADYIFISKIVSKEFESNWFSADRTLYKHQVLKTYKGELSEYTYSYIPEPKTSCDYEPQADIERIVIISGKPPFRLAGCLYGGDRVKFESKYPNWIQSLNKVLKNDSDDNSAS